MESNTLSAFIVRSRRILLPALRNKYTDIDNTFWCSARKHDINKNILIEAKEETKNGYYLYGTEIPIIFSYPNWHEYTRPMMQSCVGVETRQWAISESMKRVEPNTEFHYHGKQIIDEDVIAWLEKEKNIESMKKVREWILEYSEECEKILEEIKKRRASTFVTDASMEYKKFLEEEEQKQKRKMMIARRDELVSKYQK